jgi:hypothetical protein
VKILKVIIKDNFGRDYFTETVVAENVSEFLGKQLVEQWNNKYWNEHSDCYLELVEDDYVLYDGYADLV